MTDTTKRPLLLIDGQNNFIRNFMVNEDVSTSGELVGGTIGFLRQLRNLCIQFRPSQVIVAWEQGGGSARRKQIFPDYKANRAKSKVFSELYSGKNNPMADAVNKTHQLTLLTSALGYLPICQLYVQDVEADDILGWLVKTKFRNYDGNKIVVSTDKDFYQLLEDPTVRIYNPATKTLLASDDVKTKYGLSPRNITLARAVVGDVSDGINGVDGVGLKTMAKRFASLSDDTRDLDIAWLLEEAKTLRSSSKKPPKCFDDILANENLIRRNWKLMYLDNGIFAASQISKLEYRLEEFKPVINHLAYLKVFTAADIPVTHSMDAIPTELRFLTVVS